MQHFVTGYRFFPRDRRSRRLRPHCGSEIFAICPRRHYGWSETVQGDTGEITGGMDISEQLRTWRAFTGFLRWAGSGAGLVVLTLVVLALRGW